MESHTIWPNFTSATCSRAREGSSPPCMLLASPDAGSYSTSCMKSTMTWGAQRKLCTQARPQTAVTLAALSSCGAATWTCASAKSCSEMALHFVCPSPQHHGCLFVLFFKLWSMPHRAACCHAEGSVQMLVKVMVSETHAYLTA